MKGETLRNARVKDVNVNNLSVCGIPVLDVTMKRLVKYLIKNGINMPSNRIFNFSRQIAQVYFKKAIGAARISPRVTIRDYKEAFKSFLIVHYPDYQG